MEVDLAIVGGGPAGVSTALFFAASALAPTARIVVLEKASYPREKICAGAIGARAERALDAIGVHVVCPSVPIHGLSVAAAGRLLVARTEGRPIGRVVRRAEFDHALAIEARARGIRIEEATCVTSLELRRGHVRLETSRGSVRARAVVGADGVGSFVRRALGIPRGVLGAQVVEVDTLHASNDRPRDLLHFDLESADLLGYAWDFPTLVEGEALVCRGLYALDPGAVGRTVQSRLDVGARLERRLDRLGVREGARRRKRFAEHGLSLHEPIARPRAILVGEAAGIDPVLGEGIAQAILYGAVAGPYLARRLGEDALGFEDWRVELGRSRVGRDLSLRTRALSAVYARTRPLVERWVTGSAALALAGMRYFAGDRVPRGALIRAALDLGRAALG